jgi:hypothetical protein
MLMTNKLACEEKSVKIKSMCLRGTYLPCRLQGPLPGDHRR